MKKVVKPIIALSFIALAFLVCINYLYSQQPRRWPYIFSGLDRMGTVLIDPETILSSLNRGEIDVFTIGLAETTDAEEVMWPGDEHYPGTIPWMQADHLFVANALNEFIWKDTLEELNLFSMEYFTTCQENVNGFRESLFRFFKPKFQWGIFAYSWHTLIISPDERMVVWGEGEFPRPFKEWRKINLEQLAITAEDALQIAEEHGGREYRAKTNNGCTIFLWLNPQNFYGWEVSIGDLTMYIDPMTGEIIEPQIYQD